MVIEIAFFPDMMFCIFLTTRRKKSASYLPAYLEKNDFCQAVQLSVQVLLLHIPDMSVSKFDGVQVILQAE